jgi:hypothetical protein
MKRYHVRNAVVKALQDEGLFIEAKDNEMQIPVCNKSGDVIEQVLKPQWWVNCKPLAEEAVKVRIIWSTNLFNAVINAPSFSHSGVIGRMDNSVHVLASSSSRPNNLKRSGTAGWRRSRTGVFPVNCGGVIGAQLITSVLRVTKVA